MSVKQHSVLSASGAHRWMECSASATLEQLFPDTESEAAKEGTLAHDLCELKLRHYFETIDFGKQKYTRAVNKLKKDPLWNNEMQGYTDEYLELVKNTALAFEHRPSHGIEKRVYFGDYTLADPDDGVEGYGTADCILIGDGILHIIDFKYGKGVPVSAENNPQLSLYALGAYESYKILYPIKTVFLSIVQPRIDNISTWRMSIDELLKWGEEVKEKAKLARSEDAPFNPGESQCRFCRAKAQCRARAAENVKLAFEVHKKPPLIGNDEVGEYLKQGEDVAKWLKDLQDYALAECLAGRSVSGWKAVEGRGSREWTDMDKAFEKLITDGTAPEEMLYERKPLTLAQVEKLVGKTVFADSVGEYVEKKPGKPTLVKETDNREAITNIITAKDAFKEGN